MVQASFSKTFIRIPVVVGCATVDNFSLSFSDEGKESLYRAALIAFFQQALKQGIGKRLYSFPPSRSEPENGEIAFKKVLGQGRGHGLTSDAS